MATNPEFLLWSRIVYSEIAGAGFHFQHSVLNESPSSLYSTESEVKRASVIVERT